MQWLKLVPAYPLHQFFPTFFIQFLAGWHHMLRYYFNVNNRYVLNKLKIIMCPFIHDSWARKIVQDVNGFNSFLAPSQDVNAPDLYIPAMAFITYILVVALFMGSTFRFTPEVLGLTASTGLFALGFELLLIRLGLFIFGFPAIPLLDLLAYTGYKYVGCVHFIPHLLTTLSQSDETPPNHCRVTQITLAGIFLGNLAFYIVFALHALFMGSFMVRLRPPVATWARFGQFFPPPLTALCLPLQVKTLRLVLPKPIDERSGKFLRSYFLLAVALLQAVVAFFLCYLDFKYQVPTASTASAPVESPTS